MKLISIVLRMSPGLMERIKAAAVSQETNVSAWLRQAALRELEREAREQSSNKEAADD